MTMRIHILADESGVPESSDSLAYGSLWVQGRFREQAERSLDQLAATSGLLGELKWKKICWSNIDRYEALLGWFFACKHVAFRCLVADTSSSDYKRFVKKFSTGSYQLGFYRLYYFFLTRNIKIDLESFKWTTPEDTYKVWLDQKPWADSTRIPTLITVCNSYLRKTCTANSSHPQVLSVLEVNSKRYRLLQLADVLAGATRAANVGFTNDTAKSRFVETLESKLGRPVLTAGTRVSDRKFNVWQFKWPASA